jgi:hypothetical protein
MVGLIGHFRDEYLTGHVDRAETLPLVYECYKTYVEIATALCILMGCYAPSFASRARLFRERFREGLPHLYAEVPELSDLVTKSTNFKLRPDLTYLEVDPGALWDQTTTVLGKVLRFYLNSCLEMMMIGSVSPSKRVEKWDIYAIGRWQTLTRTQCSERRTMLSRPF